MSTNLAAVPETLAAAELFGHEKGAFEQSAILCDDGQLQVPATAPAAPRGAARPREAISTMFPDTPTLEDLKKRYISHLLTTTRGNMLRAAAILDVDRRSLYRMVARYQILRPSILND